MSEYKITVLGAGGVGKSCLVVQFVQNKFLEKYDPTIEDSYRKTVDVDGQACQLDILDTAGQEEYSNIQEEYIRNGQGFIIVYSVTSPSSLDDAKAIFQRIKEHRQVKAGDSIPLVLVGNKTDLEAERGVMTEEGSQVAQELGCTFMETSAKNRVNVDEVFFDIVRQINKGGFDPKSIEQAESQAARESAQATSGSANKGGASSAPAADKKKKKSRCVLL